MSGAQDGTDDLFGGNSPVGSHNQSAIISPDDVNRMVMDELSPNDADRMVDVVRNLHDPKEPMRFRQPSPASTESHIPTPHCPTNYP